MGTENQPFKGQLHKMVGHSQIVRRHQPTNCLSVFDNFLGLGHEGLRFSMQA